MENTKTKIVQKLDTVLPTYYELVCDSNTALPCITYTEYNNYDDTTADTFGYYRVEYMIKLWCETVADLETYSKQIDTAMRELGFTRTTINELFVDDKIEKMFIYSALGKETY